MTSFSYKEAYQQLHDSNQLTFAGATCVRYAGQIAELVRRVRPPRILDYGSGKGVQYLRWRIHERWGGILPDCYDPGVPYLSKRPKPGYRGIICCDVLEHIAEDDLPEILGDVFGLVGQLPAFVFFSICCRPSKHKTLPDGRNAHLTVKPPEWWRQKLGSYARDGLYIKTAFDM